MAEPLVRAPAPNVDLLDPRQIRTLQRDAANGEAAAVRSVAEQFEAILLTQMIKQMRKPIMPGGMFDTPEAQNWNEMVDQRMGLHLAKSGGIGLADALLKQIEFSNGGISATGAQGGAQASR